MKSTIVLVCLLLIGCDSKTGPAAPSAPTGEQRRGDDSLKRFWECDKVAVAIRGELGIEAMACDHLGGPDYVWVRLTKAKVTDATFKRLGEVPQIGCLVFNPDQMTDTRLNSLKGLTQLESLDLGRTKVTDSGLNSVEGMKRLEWLNLSGTNITDAGLTAR